MKKLTNLLVLFVLLIFCCSSLAGQSNDYRQKKKVPNISISQKEIYFIISFGKFFYEHGSTQKKLIRLDVYIQNSTLYNRNEINDIVNNYKNAEKIIRAFKTNGWKTISPLTQADILIEPIMVTAEKYINIKFKQHKFLKIFVYPCDLDPFYNKKLCKGNPDRCFNEVAKKVNYCLQSKGFDPAR